MTSVAPRPPSLPRPTTPSSIWLFQLIAGTYRSPGDALRADLASGACRRARGARRRHSTSKPPRSSARAGRPPGEPRRPVRQQRATRHRRPALRRLRDRRRAHGAERPAARRRLRRRTASNSQDAWRDLPTTSRRSPRAARCSCAAIGPTAAARAARGVRRALVRAVRGRPSKRDVSGFYGPVTTSSKRRSRRSRVNSVVGISSSCRAPRSGRSRWGARRRPSSSPTASRTRSARPRQVVRGRRHDVVLVLRDVLLEVRDEGVRRGRQGPQGRRLRREPEVARHALPARPGRPTHDLRPRPAQEAAHPRRGQRARRRAVPRGELGRGLRLHRREDVRDPRHVRHRVGRLHGPRHRRRAGSRRTSPAPGAARTPPSPR
jgi:hypothetical protein